MKLSIIVPVYNEENTVSRIIDRIKSVKQLNKEIIVVDDGSTDSTFAKLKNTSRIKLIRHPVNKGKGAAIKTGIKEVSGEYVLIQDADLEYDPSEIPQLLRPILLKKASVVYGSRFTGQRRNLFFWHWVANQFLTLTTNILYNTTLSDMETGYKLMPARLLKSLDIKSNRFDFEPEITAKVLKHGIRIWEVPISYAGREYREGKKISWKDFFPALLALIKYRFVN